MEKPIQKNLNNSKFKSKYCNFKIKYSNSDFYTHEINWSARSFCVLCREHEEIKDSVLKYDISLSLFDLDRLSSYPPFRIKVNLYDLINKLTCIDCKNKYTLIPDKNDNDIIDPWLSNYIDICNKHGVSIKVSRTKITINNRFFHIVYPHRDKIRRFFQCLR